MIKNGQEIKLIVSDIDGTILTSNREVPSSSDDAIRGLIKQKGCDFTLSTGRSLPMTMPYVEYFDLQLPFIYSSGAIYDPKINRTISATPMDNSTIQQAEEIAEKLNVGLALHTREEMYIKLNDADWEKIRGRETNSKKLVDFVKRISDIKSEIPDEIIRLSIFADTNIDKLEDINKEVTNSMHHSNNVLMSRSIEITPNNVHKGSALIQLAEYLQISPENIMAIGDSLNDIPMLQMAGVGVAMGTAPNALKDLADIVVPSADEGGYLQALELFGKNINLI